MNILGLKETEFNGKEMCLGRLNIYKLLDEGFLFASRDYTDVPINK